MSEPYSIEDAKRDLERFAWTGVEENDDAHARLLAFIEQQEAARLAAEHNLRVFENKDPERLAEEVRIGRTVNNELKDKLRTAEERLDSLLTENANLLENLRELEGVGPAYRVEVRHLEERLEAAERVCEAAAKRFAEWTRDTYVELDDALAAYQRVKGDAS